jgi:hypothetical protein
VKVERKQPTSWYRALGTVIEDALPQLETLEIWAGRDTMALRSARGRVDTLALLDELARSPESLGAPR